MTSTTPDDLLSPNLRNVPPLLLAALRSQDDRQICAALAVQLGHRLRRSGDPRDRQLFTALQRWAAGELI